MTSTSGATMADVSRFCLSESNLMPVISRCQITSATVAESLKVSVNEKCNDLPVIFAGHLDYVSVPRAFDEELILRSFDGIFIGGLYRSVASALAGLPTAGAIAWVIVGEHGGAGKIMSFARMTA